MNVHFLICANCCAPLGKKRDFLLFPAESHCSIGKCECGSETFKVYFKEVEIRA